MIKTNTHPNEDIYDMHEHTPFMEVLETITNHETEEIYEIHENQAFMKFMK